MKQVVLKINNFGWGEAKAQLGNKELSLTFDAENDFNLHCWEQDKLKGYDLKTNVKELSTINEIANEYDIEFVVEC